MSKPSCRGVPWAGPAEADHDLPEGPVVHVQDALERHPARIDVELVALEDVVVHEGHEGVVRRGDGVEIAREVQVDLVHRQHLGVAAAGRAALHAQDGAERGFAQRDHHAVPGPGQGIREPHRRGGLAFAGGGGRHRGDQHHLAGRAHGGARRNGQLRRVDLGLVGSVEFQRVRGDAGGRRNLPDRLHDCPLGNFQVAGDVVPGSGGLRHRCPSARGVGGFVPVRCCRRGVGAGGGVDPVQGVWPTGMVRLPKYWLTAVW